MERTDCGSKELILSTERFGYAADEFLECWETEVYHRQSERTFDPGTWC